MKKLYMVSYMDSWASLIRTKHSSETLLHLVRINVNKTLLNFQQHLKMSSLVNWVI